jgi:hypothetical protein
MSGYLPNPLFKEVLNAFCVRFTPSGRVLWVSDGNDPIFASADALSDLGVSLSSARGLPSVVIYDILQKKLVLIDIAKLRGLMTSQRREALSRLFGGSEVELVFVNAFRDRREFQKLLTEPPWGTVVWFADEPDHMIHFNGDRFLGPRQSYSTGIT